MIAYFTYLPHKGLDSTGTTVGLVKSDLPDDLVTVFPFFSISDCDLSHWVEVRTYLRSFLTFSSSAGRLSAKVSLRD